MKVTISMSPELHERVTKWLDGRNLSGLISDVLTGYLDENDKIQADTRYAEMIIEKVLVKYNLIPSKK